MEELQAKHRKELKELQAKITALKKSVPKGDKKKKKEHEVSRNSEEEQIDENGPASQQSSLSEQLKNSACEGSAADPPALRQTRAQKRREKKAEQERERIRRIKEAEPAAGTSAKEIEDAGITEALRSLNLRVKQVPADGN
eukprot:gene4758-6839_t